MPITGPVIERSSGRAWGVRAALSLAAVGALGSLVAVSGPAVAASGATSVQPPDSLLVAGQLDQLGRANFPNTYGGIYGLDDGATIVVELTALDPAVEAAFNEASDSIPVEFALSSTSAYFLDAIQRRLVAAWTSLANDGTHLENFWPDYRSGLEMVGVRDATPPVIAQILNVTGATAVQVFATQPAVATASRTADTVPWEGGDAVYSPQSDEGCSSGFGIINTNNSEKLLSAAHCWIVGSGIRNAICDGQAGCPSGGDGFIGSLTYRDTSYGGLDTSIINADTTNGIWKGSLGTSSLVTVAGARSSIVGYTVCNNGAYSGEICSSIDSLDHCLWLTDPEYGSRLACHENLAINSNGGIANETGDSGGPVTRTVSSDEFALGTVSAADGGTLPCIHYPDQNCYPDLYFEPIGLILDEWNASLIPPS